MQQSESAASVGSWVEDRGLRWLAMGAVFAYGALVLRTGWVSDDAFITLRVIDNWVEGHGLRWNVGERVQVFAHPLWAGLLSCVHALTREAFFTTLGVSVLVSLGAAVCVVLSASSVFAGVAAITLLMASRSFVDFSTGGLENPLSHLLLALFAWQYGEGQRQPRGLFLLGGLLAFTRADLLLLVAPAWAASLRGQLGTRGWLTWAGAGLAPFLGWLAFSLFYFGYPWPNGVYAHFGAGTPLVESLQGGARFLLAELAWDPVGVSLLVVSAVLGLAARGRREAFLCLGVGLYVAWVIASGGDAVHGQRLTPAILVSVLVIANSPLLVRNQRAGAAVVATLFSSAVAGFLLQTQSGARAYVQALSQASLLDSRQQHQALASVELIARAKPLPEGDDVNRGRDLARRGASFEEAGRVGYLGYFAGPAVHVIDRRGQTDAFLARLPSSPGTAPPSRRERLVPTGYAESLESRRCELGDRDLCPFYEAQRSVISGPLWSLNRMSQVLELNFGALAVPERAAPVAFDAP